MELQHVACSEHPTTASSEVNIKMVRLLIEEDHSITYHEMTELFSKTTIKIIMKHKPRM